MMIPALFVVTVVLIYPAVRTIYLSFIDVTGFKETFRFIGLDNYRVVFEDGGVSRIILNTVTFAILSLLVATPLALFSANLLNRSFRGRGVIRTLFLIPWITPPVVAAAIWKALYSESFSPINGLLMKLHLIDKPIAFLGNTDWGFGPVSIPMISLVLMNVWSIFPFMMIMFLAAMQNIPGELYEAATMDGAGKRRQYFSITLPMILPVLEITLLLQGIWQWNNFNSSYLLTRGGPLDLTNLLAVKVYSEAFINFKFSYASAIAVVMFLVSLIPSVLYIQRTSKEIK